MHRDRIDLEAGLADILRSPTDHGRLELIVCRPAVDEREIIDHGTLDVDNGLVGDNWRPRGSTMTIDRSANPNKQLTIMNARAAALFAGPKERWALAGDQLYVDLDLSGDKLLAGTCLAVGSAVIEITAEPHLGCAKFAARFGHEAVRFANSKIGVELHLRGVNARIVEPGTINTGDTVARVTTVVPAR